MPDFTQYVREQLPALHVPAAREAEIVAELAQQLEQVYEDAIAGGATEAEALARAHACLGDWKRLGNAVDVEEPRARGVGLGGDIRYALRFLWRNPAFTAVAVATLAFGIGGNTAVFTMADALLLRVLPYRAPEQLVAIETRKTQQPEIEPWSSALDFFDFRERARSYTTVAGMGPVWSVALTGRGPAEQLDALYVSASLFPMLGVTPAAGRVFAPEEDVRSQASNVVMLSYRFWQRRFGGSREIVGQTLVLDGSCSCTVIGVLPADFRWAGEPMTGRADTIDLYFPLASNMLTGSMRSLRFLKLVGRLKPDVTAQQANDEARAIGATLAEQFPGTNRGFDWGARPLADLATGKVRTTMMLLVAAVAFVLLMACANVANLLLARAAARQKEIAVRVALGASRGRLLRQLLIEGFVLSTLGGCVGVPLAVGVLRFLSATGPESMLRGMNLSLDARSLFVTAGAAMACALLAGLPPALRMTIDHTANALREGGRGLVAGHRRLRAVLVAGQIAAALVLLVGAGLLLRSFGHLLQVRPGIEAHNLITMSAQLPASARTPEMRTAVWQRMRSTLESTPGVSGAAAVSRLPFSGQSLGAWVYIEGQMMAGEPGRDVQYRVCTPNYFSVMGVPLVAGRAFDARDDSNPATVAMVNQTMARQLWPGHDAVGKRFKMGTSPQAAAAAWITVIGVVGDVRHFGLEAEPRPEMYRTYAVNPLGWVVMVVRARSDAARLTTELAGRIRALDPNMPAYNTGLVETLVERSTAQRRFVMLLLAAFALSALLVAGVGVYGMVAQAVAQRTAEIGLRMALGATQGSVLGLVFRNGARLMGAGIGAGLAAAIGLAWLMRGMLYAMGPFDAVVFGAAAAVLAGFGLAACWVPARRATRVDPMVALREN
jgi:putative ABC transport system permease protein